MKFVDFFAGIGGIRLGLERAGHQCVGFCEWDKFARQSYKAMYDTEGEWECHDIRTAKSYGIPKADLWTFGFPCFVAGTLVKTNHGLVPIEELQEGTKVLTHKNRYRSINQTMCRKVDKTYTIKAYGTEGLETTDEHPFYVRERKYAYKKGVKYRWFDEPKWVKTIDLNKNYYLGIPIEPVEKLPEYEGIMFLRKNKKYFLKELPLDKPEFYWFIGRWLGDGWTVSTTRSDSDSPREKVVLCCAKDELEEIQAKVDKLFNYTISEEATIYKLTFSNKELFWFLRQFGHGAANKFIHQKILQLPINLLEQVLDGYFSADGCKVKNKIKATTVSRKLAYGLAACVNKVYKKGCAIYKTERNKTHIIQGREVNQKDTYQIVFSKNKNKADKAFYEDGFIWCPIWDITENHKETLVYNIGVNTDESYTANAICCHNCQDLSIAGKRKGLQEGERSGLFYEIIRLLQGLRQEDRPQWLLAENVKGLFSAGGGFDFLRCIVELGQLGYSVEYQLLNSKDFGVPQNRERVFIVGCLGDGSGRKVFPLTRADGENPCKLQEITSGVSDAFRVYEGNGLARTLKGEAGGGGAKTGLYAIEETKIIDAIFSNREPRITDIAPTLRSPVRGLCVGGNIRTLGSYNPSGHSSGRVVDPDGIAPTVMENHGTVTAVAIDLTENKPKTTSTVRCLNARYTAGVTNFSGDNSGILVKEATKQGYTEAYDGDSVNLAQPNSQTRRGRVGKQIANTLTCGDTMGVVSGTRIRKLTPRECWRLQGFPDDYFDRAVDAGVSNSQLYKQAGNAVSVNVAEAIGRRLREIEVSESE